MPTFEPPTHRVQHIITGSLGYGLLESVAVIRLNGTLTAVAGATTEQLKAAGVEGADWFLGGHVYNISTDTEAELNTAGFATGA